MKQTMGHSEPDRIIVRGKDLCEEVIGKVDFASMFFLEVTGRLPSLGETKVVDAVLVTLMEHGITGTSLSARLTYLGAPNSLQGAVAAGILGAGEVFLGAIEQCAQALQDVAVGTPETEQDDAIDAYLDRMQREDSKIPGIGHPLHKPVDPRTPVLFALAERELGRTTHADLLQRLQQRAEERLGRSLPVNADGAIAAVLSDVGLDWRLCRGFAIVARSGGLVGHLHDEMHRPMAKQVWDLAEENANYEDPQIEGLRGGGA